MINYFIINKSGTVLYQSALQTKKKKKQSNESYRIRYLPLLVIKDLIKANFNNTIQYIIIGNKTVVFKEQQNLLYIACTKKQHLAINLIQLHLSIMHNFIKFHYGPHWSLHLQGGLSNNIKSTLSVSDIQSCLSQLPFLAYCGKLSIRSLDALCCIEQVQVGEDLRFKLTENMISCCNASFIHQFIPHQQQQQNYSPNNRSLFHHHYQKHQQQETTWAYCFLFAREKMIAQCSNNSNELISNEVVYFIKLLVSHHFQEKHESDNSIMRTTTLPQNILSTSSTETTTATSTVIINNNKIISPITTSSSSNTSSTDSNTMNTSSLLAYVYDANSTSTPFKMKEKSPSSVTVISSDSYWNQLTPSNTTTTKLLEELRSPSNLLVPSRQQQNIADILNNGNNNNNSFLSSSVPSESSTFKTRATALFNTYLEYNNDHSKDVSSAPSSPTMNRPRSRSFSINSNEDSSLKHMLSNLIYNHHDSSDYLDQDVKLFKRWIMKSNDKVLYLANLLYILLNEDGLCCVMIYKDDVEKHRNSSWKPPSNQVKQFKQELKTCLNDFTTFLLTKEATHFTNLSFAVTYPGMVHFIHLNKGVMISPILVDLNELDKHHELLHEVYDKYKGGQETFTSTQHGKWKWPSEKDLKRLCNQMLKLGINYRSDPNKMRVIQESPDKQYYFLYLSNQDEEKHQELFAIYFNMVPFDRLWHMHQKLFHDICQRVLT